MKKHILWRKTLTDTKNKYCEENIIKMLEFLVDNIFVTFAESVFQQTVGMPTGSNCASLLAVIFLYFYEAELFSLCCHLERKSQHLSSIHAQVHRWCIFHKHPRLWQLSGLDASCWNWDKRREQYICFLPRLLLSIGTDGQFHISIYDKLDDFNVHITKFPFMCSHIPFSSAFDVFISREKRKRSD